MKNVKIDLKTQSNRNNKPNNEKLTKLKL